MAKLKRTSNPAKPTSAAERAGASRQSNPTLMVGLLLAVAVALLFWVFTSRLQQQDKVMVARADIPAFSTITPADLEAKTVPKDSVTSSDLTAARYEQLRRGNSQLVNRVEILPGQRVSTAAVSSATLGSLAVVGANERVVAVSATFSGAAAGVVVPGSVVDVYSSSGSQDGSDGLLVRQAKVLAVGVGADAAANVRPDSRIKSGGGSTSIVVVLAVPKSDAGQLLQQQQVGLAYDPRLTFDRTGRICTVGRCSGSSADTTTPQVP